jgi:hypothetical protein
MADFISLKIEGAEQLTRKLSEPLVQRHAKEAMMRAMALIHDEIAKYPPPPPNSRYRRTGLLGRSWSSKTRPLANDIEGIVANTAPYAPEVQGLSQKGFHADTGWGRLDEVAKRLWPQIVEFFQEALRRVAQDARG